MGPLSKITIALRRNKVVKTTHAVKVQAIRSLQGYKLVFWLEAGGYQD